MSIAGLGSVGRRGSAICLGNDVSSAPKFSGFLPHDLNMKKKKKTFVG